MSNSKDKRIKKLKKKRIWPSIVGLFLIILIFTIILMALIGLNIQDVIQGKLLAGVRYTEPIVALFEEYEGENKQDILDSTLNYINMVPDVDAVWVSDLDGNKVWANSEKEPEVENIVQIYLTHHKERPDTPGHISYPTDKAYRTGNQ